MDDETELKEIRKAYATDTGAQRILANPEEHQSCQVMDSGMILCQGLIYVPARLHEEVVHNNHEPMAHGDPGIGKTMELLTRTYYFPGMQKQVEKVVLQCDTCIQDRPERHLPYGKLQSP